MRKLRINYSIYYLLFLILLEFIQLFKFIAYFYSTNIDFILLFLIVSQYRRSFRNWFIEFEIIIFDDIYILLHIPYFIIFYYIFQESISISLTIVIFILDTRCYFIYIQNIENRVHAILIHCSLPLDEYQFYIISFKQKMRYIKNWFTEFENIISTISINITSHFLWKNFMVCHHLYSRFHVLPRWRHELRLQ